MRINKIPIIIVRNENNRDFNWKLIDENEFSVEYINAPIDFEVFAKGVKKCFLSTKAAHVLVIYNQEIITRKFMRYVSFSAANLEFVDFYQIAGGKISLGLIRNLIHSIRNAVLIKVISRIPRTFLKILRNTFFYLPIKPSLRDLVISTLKRKHEKINRFDSDNLYLSHVITWNNARPPLEAFFISQDWLTALAHLQSKPLLTFERANIALARSGNYNAASKFRLF